MIHPDLLDILVCPETRQALQVADEELLARLNARIAEGTLTNQSGEAVTAPLDGGLVREDGRILYPVWQDIPTMLIDEAIPLDES